LKTIIILLLPFILFANINEQHKFKKWTKEFKKTLHLKHNIDNKTLNIIFKNTKLLEKVIHRDKNQLHTKITFSKYMKLIVSKKRIQKGQKKYLKYKKDLLKISKKYKVDTNVITALWGVESYYGKIQGKTLIIDSLLSLIYDGRRAKFFTKELLNTIKLLKNNNLKKTDIKGSWAGAMGACQFMPSSYISYGADGDNDGKIDIWKNNLDIFSSIANYLSKHHFKYNQPIAIEIQPTKISTKEKISLYALEDKGIKYKNKIQNIDKNLKATIKQYDNRYFLLFDNMRVIKRWNNSDFFAISVALLSQNFH
jgi:membrane-bound lytic murein transglycosylase B